MSAVRSRARVRTTVGVWQPSVEVLRNRILIELMPRIDRWVHMSDEGVPPWQIVQDIDRVESSYRKVVEARGCVVPELDKRTGHRKAAARFSIAGKLKAGAKAALDAQKATWIGLTKAL